MLGNYSIVFGNECMALYRDGHLVMSATRLTFADILEGCGIGCDLYEADMDTYTDPTKFPSLLKDAVTLEAV